MMAYFLLERITNLIKKIFLFFFVLVFTQNVFAQAKPTITSFYPTTAGPGDTVTIIGTNFTNNTYAFVGGYVITQVISSTMIKTLIGTGGGGTVFVYYSDNGTEISSDTLSGFNYVMTPYIASVIPLTATTGDTITLRGDRFSTASDPRYGTPAISFGGVPASFVTAITSHLVKAVVGNGASGNVSLTAFGTTTYPGFIYKTIQTATWIGAPDSTWEKAANWSTNAIPDAYTNVIINSGKVVLNSDATILSISANSSANLIINPGKHLTILH